MTRARALRALLASGEPEHILEAHNALSALLGEEAGFRGLWASSLGLSASFGCRDTGELSATQVLDVLESITDRVAVPVLFDGDTGYGSFNHFQRLVRKLSSRGVAGVCIEDQSFPKTNSLRASGAQALAPVDEFCGKLRAGQDARTDPDFVIVARTEAFIAGLGVSEALARAHRYADAGADAVLVHSRARTAHEIAEFMAAWDGSVPVVCVPTTYYGTAPDAFGALGISVVIWANHMIRAAVSAMREVAHAVRSAGTARGVEDRIASVAELFRLQDLPALERAERRYERAPSAIVLAASRGDALGELTAERPKCLVPVGGEPILHRLLRQLRREGVREISVVRGFAPAAFAADGVHYVDNPHWSATGELGSLRAASTALVGDVLVAYGDLVLKGYILHELLASPCALTVVVDTAPGREVLPVDRVKVSRPAPARYGEGEFLLRAAGAAVPGAEADGEWVGLLLARGEGTRAVAAAMALASDTQDLPDLLNHLLAEGATIHVLYVRGDWIDVDTLADLGPGGLL